MHGVKNGWIAKKLFLTDLSPQGPQVRKAYRYSKAFLNLKCLWFINMSYLSVWLLKE